MRRGLLLLVLGVLGALVGVASARANGIGTTATTTTGTTDTTTTTTTPTYAPLATSVLPADCVGAGAAAVVPPGHSAVAVGTPASDFGPSGYPASASVVAFGSSSVSGSTCRSAKVTLSSVSLFQGAVTATSVEATDGQGTVAGLEIGRTPVSAASGRTIAIGSWGLLTLGEKFGRLTAPLVLRLVQAHASLRAGTRIAVAFSAASQPGATRREKSQLVLTDSTRTTPAQSQDASSGKKHRQPAKPPPDFPAKPYPFQVDGGGLAPAARRDPVVATAMRYLGIRYQWGGASPATGFDCSGLVQYVFAQLGVPLVHYAAAQYDAPDAVWVSPKRLQPGDLVFFTGSDGTRKAPGHVGIYVDDGYFIDAPHTGSFVRIDRLTEQKFADEYVGAKRIVASLEPRHLLHVTTSHASSTGLPVGFPTPLALEPVGESLGIAAAGASTIRTAASRGYWIWAGAGLGALILLLGTVAGVFVLRRRGPADAAVY